MVLQGRAPRTKYEPVGDARSASDGMSNKANSALVDLPRQPDDPRPKEVAHVCLQAITTSRFLQSMAINYAWVSASWQLPQSNKKLWVHMHLSIRPRSNDIDQLIMAENASP